jgi:predicted RNA-binding Zn-ribbon protein involved in translation (DUF1610 family)
MPYYAVCTECDFLRVLTEHADPTALPDHCPNCGAEVLIREKGERFEPTYVGRVSRAVQRAEL